MPRQADHERRKRELVEATLALIYEQGIASVSVRNVAARAGWSVGALRYYFPQQDDLVIAAARAIHHNMIQNILAVANQRWTDPVRQCIAMVESALPIDELRIRELRLIYCFIDMARFSPELDAVMDDAWQITRCACRLMIAGLAEVDPPADRDPFTNPMHEQYAAHLHIYWDGLCTQGLVGRSLLTPDQLRAVTTDLILNLNVSIQSGKPIGQPG